MKSICMLIAILMASTAPGAPCWAVDANPSPEQISRAISFGTAERAHIQRALEQRYANPSHTPYDDRVLVRTKWCKLAYLAAVEDNATEAFRIGRDAILDDHCLQIDIRVFGHNLHFARDYQVLLISGDTTIAPCKKHADHYQVRRRTGPARALPGYAATIRTYFPYDAIAHHAVYTLKIDANGVRRNFELDLSAYR